MYSFELGLPWLGEWYLPWSTLSHFALLLAMLAWSMHIYTTHHGNHDVSEWYLSYLLFFHFLSTFHHLPLSLSSPAFLYPCCFYKCLFVVNLNCSDTYCSLFSSLLYTLICVHWYREVTIYSAYIWTITYNFWWLLQVCWFSTSTGVCVCVCVCVCVSPNMPCFFTTACLFTTFFTTGLFVHVHSYGILCAI